MLPLLGRMPVKANLEHCRDGVVVAVVVSHPSTKNNDTHIMLIHSAQPRMIPNRSPSS